MRIGAIGSLACALLAVAGCGGSEPARRPPPKPVVASLDQPRDRCGSPELPARVVRLRTADGVTLDGAEVGSGPAGAVFLHESPSDLCDWWPYADAFAKAHIRALMIDLRCFGRSGCPDGSGQGQRPTEDVTAAVAELRRQGVRTVSVVGASFGGASALVAGSKLGRRVDGVVSLSGEEDLSDTLDVPPVIGRMRAPLLMAVAPGDRYVSVAQARSMVRKAGSRHKRLLVRPAADGHGTQLLGTDTDDATPLLGILTRFVRAPG